MHPERRRQGGTWIDPKQAGAPVRFIDSDSPGDDDPGEGRWLAGLEVHACGDHLLCHGPMGVAIAEGARLIDTIGALVRGETRKADRDALAACNRTRAWVAGGHGLEPARERAWTALRVSPARAAQTLREARRWRAVALGTEERAHAAFAQALERALARLGFERAPDGARDAWPLLWVGRLDDEPLLDAARALAGTQGTRPWAAVHPGWMGWLAAAGAGSAPEHAARACPQCLRQALEAGPWTEVLAAATPMRPMATRPGEALARGAREDAEGCARLIARTLASTQDGHGAALRWWPCDEGQPRGSETIARDGECRACGRPHDTARGRFDGTDAVDVPAVLKALEHGAGPWAGALAGCDDMEGTALFDLEWGFASNTTRSARARNVGQVRGLPGRRHNAGGKGTSVASARAGALAETIEREALSWRFAQAPARIASVAALEREGTAHLAPDALGGWSARQYAERGATRAKGWCYARVPAPLEGPERERPIAWCEGVDLLCETRRTVLAPQSWVYMGAPPDRPEVEGHPDERYLCLADTNGCAAGPTRAEAAARAYCELVERDAFALWWYGRVRLPGLEARGLGDPWLDRAPERFQALGRTLWLLDATIDARLPVVIATSARTRPVKGTGEWDVVCTAGCAPSVRHAARRAVTEQVQLGPSEQWDETSYYAGWESPEFREISRWSPSTQRWLTPRLRRGRGSEAAAGTQEKVRDTALLARAKAVARARGTSMIAFDLTRARTRLPVVRVASPELVHFWHRLGHPRHRTGAREAGWTRAEHREEDLNPTPVVL